MNLNSLTSFHTIRIAMRWLSRFSILASIILIVALYVSSWPLELIISFAPLWSFLLLGVLLAIITTFVYTTIRVDDFFRYKKNRMEGYVVLLSIIMITLSTGLVFSRGPQKPLVTGGSSLYKFATFNVLYTNSDVDSVSAQLRENAVSVAGFQEIQPSQVETIKNNLGYKYSFVTDSDVSAYDTEIAVVSRHPILSAELLEGYENGGIVRSQIAIDGRTYSFYIVHFTPPYSAEDYGKRGDLFNTTAELVNQDHNPAFVLGDFNTTVYSPHLQAFKTDTEQKIALSSKRHLPQCSWFGFGPVTCMRIDHIFVPKDVQIEHVEVGDYVGSDHRPVITEVSL